MYYPKGEMCMVCKDRDWDCSDRDFEDMPVTKVDAYDDHEVICTEFVHRDEENK